MPQKSDSSPRCSLYLVTPPLAGAVKSFAEVFAEVLAKTPVASALVRLAPHARGDARTIVTPLRQAAVANACALLIEEDGRLAARLGLDGVHVGGAGEELRAAVESQHPDRIVGAGALRTRDEAMSAGQAGADYVMFGEPRGGARTMAPDVLIERVEWWAEIFETPCVAYADSIETAGRLARAGADFVALDEAVWGASSPFNAASEVSCLLAEAAGETR